MTSLLICLAGLGIVPAQAANPSVPVKVGDQTVSVRLPSAVRPLSDSTPSVQFQGVQYEFLSANELGRVASGDGSWKSVAEAYRRNTNRANRTPKRFKVLIFSNSTIIDRRADGVIRQRRGGLEPNHIDEVYQGLGQFKMFVEAGLPGVEVLFDVQVDSDMVVDDTSAENGIFGDQFLEESVAPRLNDDPFEADDRIFRGPYEGVFAIHGGLIRTAATNFLQSTPVSTIGFHLFSDRPAADSLGLQLAAAWQNQVAGRWFRASGRLVNFVPATGDDLPVDPDVPSLVDRWIFGNVSVASPDLLELAYRLAKPEAAAFGMTVDGDKIVVAAPAFALRHRELLGDLVAVGPVRGRAMLFFRMPVTTGGTTLLEWLRIPGIPAMPIEPMPEPLVVDGYVRLTPVSGGSYVASVKRDPVGGDVLTVQHQGTHFRGSALIAGGGKATFTPGGAEFVLQLKVRYPGPDPIALHCLDENGKLLRAAVLWGPADPGPNVTFAELATGADWHTIRIAVPALCTSLRVGPPPGGELRGRLSVAGQILEIAEAQVIAGGAVTEAQRRLGAGEDLLTRLGTIGDSLTSPQSAMLTEAMSSGVVESQMTAAGVLAKLKPAELEPALIELTRSGNPATAHEAVRALAAYGTASAWASLEETIQRGPFDHNRRFAAVACRGRKSEARLAGLMRLLGSVGWRTRLEGIRGLGEFDSRQALVILATVLQDVEPACRLAAATAADPNVDVTARRLLFAAVNDPIEIVRLVALSRLIDSEIPAIRSEALRGIKDESPRVRRGLLAAMTERKQAHYRPALQLAVIDPDPSVRVAALEAIAVSPGEVVIGEVRSTLTDPNPAVQLALLKLAKAKRMQLPGDLLARLAASPNAKVARLAQELRG